MTRSTLAWPALIAFASLVGLIVALTGDGWRDAFAWTALALPLAAVAWSAIRHSH